MIFGKTSKTKDQIEQDLIMRKISGIERFAYLPIKLQDGRWLWLQKFYAYYRGDKMRDGQFSLVHHDIFDYYYKAYSYRSDSFIMITDRHNRPKNNY